MRTFRVISRVIAPVILCVTYMYMYAYVSLTIVLGCQPFSFPTFLIACVDCLYMYIKMFLLILYHQFTLYCILFTDENSENEDFDVQPVSVKKRAVVPERANGKLNFVIRVV